MAEPDNGRIRASDADRESVAQRLRAAFDEGRITLSEYDDRLQAAYAAITLGDLAPLTADLPAPPKPPAEVARRERDRRKLAREWRDWAGTALILVGVWAVTSLLAGAPAFFWPIIPMGIWALVIITGMAFGDRDPADDDDGDNGRQC